MSENVSLRDANQHFSRYVAAVERGERFVITRRGRPVARLVPIEVDGKRALTPEQEAARQRTIERLNKGYRLGGRHPTRDEMHERR